MRITPLAAVEWSVAAVVAGFLLWSFSGPNRAYHASLPSPSVGSIVAPSPVAPVQPPNPALPAVPAAPAVTESPPAPAPIPEPPLPGKGDLARLVFGGDTPLPVAIDEDSYKEVVEAFRVNDMYGLMDLYNAGRVFLVTCPVKCLILKIDYRGAYSAYGPTRVRIMSGPHKGLAGWVSYAFISPL